ncbi:MAG: DUF983 domain-containing protein [Bacteroidetes bacterium]|nr:MAG: DUF983 domain-containing protein [Bacteroidota bacterium]
MDTVQEKPNYWISVLDNRCPRCRRGKLFENSNPYKLKTCVKMNPKCPVCGQPTDIEVGFYYGTAYVSYAITVLFSLFTFFAWWLIIGFSLNDGDFRLLWWGIVNAVLMILLQPIFMRLSRSLWISWFVKYDPHWGDKSVDEESLERIVPEQMNNW